MVMTAMGTSRSSAARTSDDRHGQASQRSAWVDSREDVLKSHDVEGFQGAHHLPLRHTRRADDFGHKKPPRPQPRGSKRRLTEWNRP